MNNSYNRFTHAAAALEECVKNIEDWYLLDRYNINQESIARDRIIELAYLLLEELGASIDCSIDELKEETAIFSHTHKTCLG